MAPQKRRKLMLAKFRTYQLAVTLYRSCKQLSLPGHLKDQLLRAASSVVLNLSEGSAKPTPKDRQRFYSIAFASLREVQSVIDLDETLAPTLEAKADVLAAHLYRLTH